MNSEQTPHYTVLLPCLNEAQTIGPCIREARAGIRSVGLPAEILVADNGSTDGSPEIASAEGARVICVREKGYGNTLRAGILQSHGRYVILADSDGSYPLNDLAPFLNALEQGAMLVLGNRFKGQMEKGAMPFMHRYFGVPVLSLLAALRYGTPVLDYHCGLRAVDRAAFMALPIHAGGMEFATEMIGAFAKSGAKITEIPIDFRRDGRGRPSHLRSIRDGLRHLGTILSPLPKGDGRS